METEVWPYVYPMDFGDILLAINGTADRFPPTRLAESGAKPGFYW